VSGPSRLRNAQVRSSVCVLRLLESTECKYRLTPLGRELSRAADVCRSLRPEQIVFAVPASHLKTRRRCAVDAARQHLAAWRLHAPAGLAEFQRWRVLFRLRRSASGVPVHDALANSGSARSGPGDASPDGGRRHTHPGELLATLLLGEGTDYTLTRSPVDLGQDDHERPLRGAILQDGDGRDHVIAHRPLVPSIHATS